MPSIPISVRAFSLADKISDLTFTPFSFRMAETLGYDETIVFLKFVELSGELPDKLLDWDVIFLPTSHALGKEIGHNEMYLLFQIDQAITSTSTTWVCSRYISHFYPGTGKKKPKQGPSFVEKALHSLLKHELLLRKDFFNSEKGEELDHYKLNHGAIYKLKCIKASVQKNATSVGQGGEGHV